VNPVLATIAIARLFGFLRSIQRWLFIKSGHIVLVATATYSCVFLLYNKKGAGEYKSDLSILNDKYFLANIQVSIIEKKMKALWLAFFVHNCYFVL